MTFDAAAMARGEPGLPAGITWRARHYDIAAVLASWKQDEADNHAAGGSLYYRKRFWRIRTNDDHVMTVYALRHVKRGENARRRWWLYTVEDAHDSSVADST